MKIDHSDEIHHLMITPYLGGNTVNMIEIDRIMKIYYHCDENSSSQIYDFGYLGSAYQCDQLYFFMFGCIWLFSYFPGWLVGWG